MILRRLMSHVSDQNWFAVILDFVIVVLGVAVGFQLTGYYDERQRQSTETTYLTGISTDYGIYQTLLMCRTEGEAALVEALNTLIGEIDGTITPDADQRADILRALPMSHVVQPGLAMEGNTSALVSGDLVKTIRDDVLRGRILAAQSISSVAVTQLDQISDLYQTIPRFDGVTTRHWDDTLGYWIVVDYDLAAMRADESLSDDLMNLVNLHRGAEMTDARLLVSVNSVVERLVELGVREASTPSCRPNI